MCRMIIIFERAYNDISGLIKLMHTKNKEIHENSMHIFTFENRYIHVNNVDKKHLDHGKFSGNICETLLFISYFSD